MLAHDQKVYRRHAGPARPAPPFVVDPRNFVVPITLAAFSFASIAGAAWALLEAGLRG